MNFLHERFLVTVDKPTNFTIGCRNGSAVSSTKYPVEGTRIISLPVTCSLSSKVMSCSSIDIIDRGDDVRLPVKTGYAEILNLTHESLQTLQLEKTDWETAAVGPHTDAFSLSATPWYQDTILMLGRALAAITALTILSTVITFVMHYKRKLRAIAAAVATPLP